MLWLLVLGVVSVLVWFGFGIRRISAVSKGQRIRPRNGEAILLVDLQTVFWTNGPYDKLQKETAARVIRKRLEAAKTSGHPVIALRQEWSLPATRMLARIAMKGQALAGHPGTEVATPFFSFVDDEVIKRVQDGFETGALDALLAERDIGVLTIMGLDGEHCVSKTAQAALNRGYTVRIVPDGILTARTHRHEAVCADLVGLGATVL